MKIDFEPHVCESCNQTTEYILSVDRGTVDIVRAIAVAIGKKGINAIHPRKEMERDKADIGMGLLTSNQVGNLSRPRFHGLIASLDGGAGNYCLTRKGAKFLHGGYIPRYAIISKSEGHQIGYVNPEELTCCISDYKDPEEYWEAINYEIHNGQIIRPDEKALCPQCGFPTTNGDLKDFGKCLSCDKLDTRIN